MKADAVIVGTPIYRGSYTGAFKNFFDLVPNDALAGKVMGVMATAGSRDHYLAIDHALRPLFSFFQCLIAPHPVYLQEGDFSNGELLPDALGQINRLVLATLHLCRATATGPEARGS